MTVLVTGGTGYIGSHTCVELLQEGMDPVIVDNLSNSSRNVLDRIERVAGKRPVFYELDVRDERALSGVFDSHRIDCVFHFAALKKVEESIDRPLAYYENNVGGTLTLCRVMQKHGVKQIVFSSSATVYSADDAMPLREDANTGNCTNPYGMTKYMCEQILRDTAKASGDFSAVLLRYFNPVGAHESGLLGEHPSGKPGNLMPYITQAAAGKQPCLRVFGGDYGTPDGTAVRDYIHVMDLARGHVAAMKWARTHTGVEVFNLGTGRGYSVLEMIRTFQEVNGAAVPYEVTERRRGDLAVCYADPGKSERLLGWKAVRTVEDMCRDAWNWQCGNPDGYSNG